MDVSNITSGILSHECLCVREADGSFAGCVQASRVQDDYGGLARWIDCIGIHCLESDRWETSSCPQSRVQSMVFLSSGGTTHQTPWPKTHSKYQHQNV